MIGRDWKRPGEEGGEWKPTLLYATETEKHALLQCPKTCFKHICHAGHAGHVTLFMIAVIQDA